MQPFNPFAQYMAPPEFQKKPCLLVRFSLVRQSKSGSKFIKDLADIDIVSGIEDLLWRYRNAGYYIAFLGSDSRVAAKVVTWQEHQKEVNRTHSLFVENPFNIGYIGMTFKTGNDSQYDNASRLTYPELGVLGVLELNAWEEQSIGIEWDKTIFIGKGKVDQTFAEQARLAYIDFAEFMHPEYNHTV